MPGACFHSAKHFLSEQRMIKTKAELDVLRQANKVAEQAHYYAAQKAHSGMTELEYARLLSEYLFANGIETINKLVVGAGERSEHPNANPHRLQLQEGELVRADIFAKVQGYLSDVARTGVVGKPSLSRKKYGDLSWRRGMVSWTKFAQEQAPQLSSLVLSCI